jgi:hypothetical protein
LSQIYLTTIRAEGKDAVRQLGDGTRFKIGGRADGYEVLPLSVSNPSNGFIPWAVVRLAEIAQCATNHLVPYV